MAWVLVLFFLTGCSTVSNSQKRIYEEGYRHAVQEQVGQVVAQFQGGSFPYFHWSAPLVQQVRIPAHLANGVMIPEHNELVIITPGQWTMSGAYPIQRQEGKKYDNQISHMHVGDITALPNNMGFNKQDYDGRAKSEDYSRRMEK